MKKLLPLILLAACSDPNAELLAKYKNLELENKGLTDQLENVRDFYKRMDLFKSASLEECRHDLKQFVCAKKNKDSLDWRVLCLDKPEFIDLPK